MIACSYLMKLYNDAGVVKTEAAELDGGLGFMEDSCAHLSSLVSVPEVEESSCIETIAFSSFNPVPGYRRYIVNQQIILALPAEV